MKSGWTTRRLGELLLRHNEIIHPGDRRDGEAVFVGLEHISPHTGRRIGSLTVNLGKLTGRKPTFLRGQIVYGYLRPYLNKVWIAEFDGCCSVDQFAFAVRQDLADASFVAAFMRSPTFLRRAEVVTTTGQLPRISIDEIEAVQIELPPTLDEQRRIAADLSGRISEAERLTELIHTKMGAAQPLPAAYLRAVFEGPESSGWETVRLDETCDLLPSKSISTEGDVVVRAITTACLSERGFLPAGIKTGRMRAADVGDCLVRSGEVLVARSNTPELVGRVAIYHGEPPGVVATDLTIRIWPRDHLSGEFLAAFLSYRFQTGYWKSRAGGASGTMKKITRAQLLAETLRVPAGNGNESLAEQRRIAVELSRRISGADRVRQTIRGELAAIEALSAAFSREAFQGHD